MKIVILDETQLREAFANGCKRAVQSICRGDHDSYGFVDKGHKGIVNHIVGSCAEQAASVATGIEWTGHYGVYSSQADLRDDIEVRCRFRHDWDLLIRPDADPKAWYVHVTCESLPEFYVHGFIRASAAMDERYAKNYGGRPKAYFVPKEELLPLEFLY